MAEFSEQILWRDDTKKSRLEDRWHKGVYLGPSLRSFRRLPDSQKAAPELVKRLRGVPWKLDGNLEEVDRLR
eukprot:3896575-Amphidinium_carterae.1